jgi:hypothetical protein
MSLGGDPLSEFTDKFCQAATKQDNGPVYYIDIISRLKDEYLDNPDRQPHFVFQSSGRETLVDDATVLATFRDKYNSEWSNTSKRAAPNEPVPGTEVAAAPSMEMLLAEADERAARPELVAEFVKVLFDELTLKVQSAGRAEFFDFSSIEHSGFKEWSTRGTSRGGRRYGLLLTESRDRTHDHSCTCAQMHECRIAHEGRQRRHAKRRGGKIHSHPVSRRRGGRGRP